MQDRFQTASKNPVGCVDPRNHLKMRVKGQHHRPRMHGAGSDVEIRERQDDAPVIVMTLSSR
jgi:hypothetical protein